MRWPARAHVVRLMTIIAPGLFFGLCCGVLMGAPGVRAAQHGHSDGNGRDGREWGVHLASYRVEANVDKGWRAFQTAYPTLLGGLAPARAVVHAPDQGRFTRLIAGPFPNRDAAAAVCRNFERQGVYAAVLPFPERAAPSARTAAMADGDAPAEERLAVRIRHITPAEIQAAAAHPVRVVKPGPAPDGVRGGAETKRADRSAREVVAAPSRLDTLTTPRSGFDGDGASEEPDVFFHAAALADPRPSTMHARSQPKATTGAPPFFAGVAVGEREGLHVAPGVSRTRDGEIAPAATIGVSF